MSASISFTLTDSLLQSLNQTQDEFTQQMRLLMALHLFKIHKLTLGQASELANMNREKFINELDNQKIAMIDYDPDGLIEELNSFNPEEFFGVSHFKNIDEQLKAMRDEWEC